MTTILAKLRRGKYLPLLLGLLLFGNGFLHLCYHAHLHDVSGVAPHSLRAAADDASVLSSSPCHVAAATAGEFFCPCCSSAVDWWCAPASENSSAESTEIIGPRRDPAPPEFRCVSKLRARAPPLS